MLTKTFRQKSLNHGSNAVDCAPWRSLMHDLYSEVATIADLSANELAPSKLQLHVTPTSLEDQMFSAHETSFTYLSCGELRET